MTTLQRRFLTALTLVVAICVILPINASAATFNMLNPENHDWKTTMNAMGRAASEWLTAFRACVIPLLIVRYAANGLKLIGNTLLSKGEYRLDDIKKDIFYSTLAAITIVILPLIVDWAIALFSAGKWTPPPPAPVTKPTETPWPTIPMW